MAGRSFDGRTYTLAEAVKLLGVELSSVKRWKTRGWIVNRPDGSLDVAETLNKAAINRDPTHGGRTDRLIGGTGTDIHRESIGDGDAAELLRARILIAMEDAKSKTLKNAEREQSLIPRDRVMQVFTSSMAVVRSSLESMIVRLPNRLVGLTPTEARRLLRQEVDSILQEMADELDPDRETDD